MAKKSATTSGPDSGWRSGRALDSTFSFILRVRFDYSPDNGSSRPLFRLEDVMAGREWRFTDYASAAECLALRVEDVIHRLDPG